MEKLFDLKIISVSTIFGNVLTYEKDLITNHLLEFGAHGRSDLAFFLSALELGDYTFDLGAHIGTFSIPMAKKIGNRGKLLCVEGISQTHEILLNNLRINNLTDRCIAINKIIAPSNLNFEPILSPSNTGAVFFTSSPNNHHENDECTHIKKLAKQHFIPRVIKLDIEGYEFLSLKGSILEELKFPIVFLEISKGLLIKTGCNIDELNSLLFEQGYRVFTNFNKVRAANDHFIAREIANLDYDERTQFNALAIHKDDRRLQKLLLDWDS